MDELLAEFIAETHEMHEAITGEIVAWEQDPSDRERLDAIFRFIHTVKGSSGFLNLDRLQKLSHSAESTLSAVRAGERSAGAGLVSTILAVIDRICDIVSALEAGEPAEGNDEDLLKRLAGDESEPAEQTASVAVSTKPSQPVRTIRVPVELLDQLMAGVSDLVLARNEVSRQLRAAGVSAKGGVAEAFDKLSGAVGDMRDAISWTRMQRIEKLFAALPRVVRDLSVDLGKSVSLQIAGSDVELDREMIEMLRDPLVHIVRNALDHGIEIPADRRAAGKNPNGVLRIAARQAGNQIVIDIHDDGRGIAGDALVEKAVAMEVIEARQASDLSEEEKLELVFSPGLSTAQAVSQVSGRGVGMDVVRTNIERIGGSIDIRSEADKGTSLTLRVPLTLTIIPSLVIGLGEQSFALPRLSIERIASLAAGQAKVERIGGAETVLVSGRRMPLVRLCSLLELGDVGASDKYVVVHRLGKGERYALAVPHVVGHEDLVVKPIAPIIAAPGLYAGAALPDSGRPLLLFDPVAVAERAGLRLAEIRRGVTVMDEAKSGAATKPADELMLFDDCDGVRRALPMGVVEYIDEVDARDIVQAAGGMRMVSGDRAAMVIGCSAPPESGRAVLLRLGDGQRQLYYLIGGRPEPVAFGGEIDALENGGLVSGLAVVDGQAVEILDPHALFASAVDPVGETSADERPACLLTGGEQQWCRDFLAPLVAAAGYRAVFDERDGDIAVTLDLGSDEGRPDSDDVIRLSDAADAASGALHRYDRAGIFGALTARLSGKGGR